MKLYWIYLIILFLIKFSKFDYKMAEHGDYITFEEKIETYKKFHSDSTDHNKNWLVNTVN